MAPNTGLAKVGPTAETGHTNLGLVPWQGFVDTSEQVPELAWPLSIRVYDSMITDGQVAGVMDGLTGPIRAFRWSIDPNGAREEVYLEIARQFGLPVLGREPEPQGRLRGRFDHDEHLRHALTALRYGHYFANIVGGYPDEVLDPLWKLRKLSPRMPSTISQIKVASDGGLEAIVQYGTGKPGEPIAPEIPVSELVAYVWDKEGSNWFGRSILRACYKHWLIKDRLLRVDAIKHERNGMGIPTMETKRELSKGHMEMLGTMAQQVRSGEASGGALPPDVSLHMRGVEGSLPDTLGSIRYHDEMIAKRLLQLWMNLGGDAKSGNRALGDTFVDQAGLSQIAVAKWYANITTAHVIEDIVDWNWGEDEAAPRLVFERTEDEGLALADLAQLVEKGIITVDAELEAFLRERYQLPPKPEATVVAPAAPEVKPNPVPAARARRAPRASFALPVDRPMRRQPYPHEVAAATDYGALEAQYVDTVETLTAQWVDVRAVQAQELADLVEAAVAADDVAALGTLSATPQGAALIEAALAEAATQAAEGAVAEAVAQGVAATMIDATGLAEAAALRAGIMENLLASSISEAAGRYAMQLVGGSLDASTIGGMVLDYLNGLSDSFISQQMGGAVTAAQNVGRGEVFREYPPASIYASELLDSNTCSPCANIDGTEYDTMDDATADYPSGGYIDCDGGVNCRGTLVAIHDEAESSA